MAPYRQLFRFEPPVVGAFTLPAAETVHRQQLRLRRFTPFHDRVDRKVLEEIARHLVQLGL